jgi:chaperonin cofactor prefoldin
MTKELTEVEQRLYALIMHAVKKADDALSVAEKALNEVELIKQDMTLEYWKIGSN